LKPLVFPDFFECIFIGQDLHSVLQTGLLLPLTDGATIT